MSRFRAYQTLDDAGMVDGDGAFYGMDSRTNGSSLNAGVVSMSKNMRFDRATARPRKGAIAQNLGITLEHPPVVLPFYLPEEGVYIYNDYTDGARAAGVYRGKAFPKEPLQLCKGGVLYDWTIVSRGREYTATIDEYSTDLVEKDYLILVFVDKIYLFDPEEGLSIRAFSIPDDTLIPNTDRISVIQTYDKIIVFRGQDEDGVFLKPLVWDGDPHHEFELAPDAEAYYSIPRSSYGLYNSNRLFVPLEYVQIAVEKLEVKGNVATAQTALDHGLKVGMKITIAGADTALLNGEKIITAVTELEYELDENGDPKADEDGNLVVKTHAGFSFACKLDDMTDSGESIEGQFKSRDEYVVSGILEPFEYDMIEGHFTPNKGDADWLVGFAPYQQFSILVFYRKSIYLHSGLNDLSESAVDLVTREVGCLARRSIATIGSNIFFLSDEGVYSLKIVTELNLVGAGEPLSRDIDDQIRRINIDAAHRACAVFCENRYYLAAPVDGSDRNNAIFIYNTLNAKWESIDTYPDALYFDTMVVATCRGKKRVFAMSREGGIVMLEEREDGDEVGTIGSVYYEVSPVAGEIQTRMYDLKTTEVKKWTLCQISVGFRKGEKFEVHAELESPASEVDAQMHEPAEDGEAVIRHRIGRRAHKAKIICKTSAGRPEFRKISVEGNVKTSGLKTER